MKTVDEVASVESTEKKLKVKLDNKTGIATVTARITLHLSHALQGVYADVQFL